MTKKTVLFLVGAVLFTFVAIAVYAATDASQTVTNDTSITSAKVCSLDCCKDCDTCEDCDGNCEDCCRDCDGNCEDCENCDDCNKPCKGQGGKCGSRGDSNKCGGYGSCI
ncbi:MAG: hypothetical protein PVJ60_06245 [Phycisphaerales bacterium]